MRQVGTLIGAVILTASLACAQPGEEPSEGSSAPEAPLDPAFEPTASRLAPGFAEGSLRLVPDRLRVAQVGTYVIRFTVGPAGIATGGGVLIDIPKAWFSELYPWSKPFQREQPDAAHFVAVDAHRVGAVLSFELQRKNFDGKTERFSHIVAVRLTQGRLQQGDRITVTLHHTTAPFLSGKGAIRAAVDGRGDGAYRILRHGAPYRVSPGEAERFALLAPSQAAIGRPVTMQLTGFDRYYNPAPIRGSVRLRGLDAAATTLGAGSQARSFVRFLWTPRTTGFHWPVAVVDLAHRTDTPSLRVPGGPVRVFRRPPEERIFWGDLHVHSAISKDAVGDGAFHYAREVTRLDFLASTEHSDDDVHWRREKDGITPEEWKRIQASVRAAYEPGRFVSLLGYECTLHHGHHCVYFRSDEGVPWNPRRVWKVENLWKQLDPGAALTVPHHLGRSTWMKHLPAVVAEPRLRPPRPAPFAAQRGPLVDWSGPRPDPAELRPALEIYSGHGSSERYDLADPLAYNKALYLPSVPKRGPYYAQDAWALGHRVGVVAGSDNHSAQPGLQHLGLTAVRATELRRETIFDAILARRTYATTGERIYLEFEVAGTRMGDVGRSGPEPPGRLLVAAPRAIRYVELMRWRSSDRVWEVAERWDESGRLLEAEFTDSAQGSGEVIYYARAELVGRTSGRVARVWSSPIWLEIQP